MDHVPDWKGPPAKCVCKCAPSLTVSINGKSVLDESKYFSFSQCNYSISSKFPNLYSSIS